MVAITVQGADLVKRIVERLYPFIEIDLTSGVFMFYKFSDNIRQIRSKHGVKYLRLAEEIERNIREGKEYLHGLRVLRENSWRELFGEKNQNTESYQVYKNSIIPLSQLEPEEEFLRNYQVDLNDISGVSTFVEMRAKNEMQIFGDLPIKVWALFIDELGKEMKMKPLGIDTVRDFVYMHGEPFHQGVRDLSRLEDFNTCYTTPLLLEMCCMESILEFNVVMRMREEGISALEFGTLQIDPLALLREFFIICLPHPKKINNILRSPYSWFVKMWGVAADNITVLESDASDDRNAKDVYYTKFRTVSNSYTSIFKGKFYRDSLKMNQEKVQEAVKYSQELGLHQKELAIFSEMLKKVYTTPFYPFKPSNVILASFLLSIQTITGYGRAWVKNAGTDFEKQMKPAADNLISDVSDRTRENFIKAYKEAEEKREEIVKPEDLYTSMLRLARNTSSGFSTELLVQKRFGPKTGRREMVKITSRIKALVIFTKGHTVFTESELRKKYNTTELYQTKGSRDVPIKSTRTIYSINLSVLVPQLVVTLPLNEYFARVGGVTSPEYSRIGGKVIVGDLEATGSRVMDAADTFRNSGDETILTIAIDYSEYDTHLTYHNFRKGMLEGIRQYLTKYANLRYEGYSLNELVEFGYGEGRVSKTLWNGKRRVFRASLSKYLALEEGERSMISFRPPFGVKPVSSLAVAEKIADEKGEVLVSPTDGSDLALIDTHLSGENSTLIANSMHNMAIGGLIQEKVLALNRHDIVFLSEQYVGDDTLLYCKLNTRDSETVNRIIDCIFDTVRKCGHEASPSKTVIAPFTVEKTQTHAKQGIYIPQDRMMIISSERRKDIEDVQGYVRSQVQTMITKVSRGFCHDLAILILMLKATFIGAWKLKRTVKDQQGYRDRKFDSDEEDGFTLVVLRNPLSLFVPLAWNGYGAHPAALNIVMTEEIFIDSLQMRKLDLIMEPIKKIVSKCLPPWNETTADKRNIYSETKMSFFSRMARPAVQVALASPEIMDAVDALPLGDFSPGRLSKTMMHSALLKESTARGLLAAGYEAEYQKALNRWSENAVCLQVFEEAGVISTTYAKLFDLLFEEEEQKREFIFPDQNLSPQFYIQKMKIGPRQSTRMRISYVDRIDVILRKDVVMRGFITANTILNVLEQLGTNHTASDLTTIFTLMNIEHRVAEELSEYLTSERIRFDALKLLKKGIAGDEFTMSLDVATQKFVDRFIVYPYQLTKTELDAVMLYCSQIVMLRAATGEVMKKMRISVPDEEKRRFKIRAQRFRTHIPKIKVVKKLLDLNRMSVRNLENQFV
ncbi:VP1 [Pata virus]|nr:VP1 [Pata virus]